MAVSKIQNGMVQITDAELGITVVPSVFSNKSFADKNVVLLSFEIPAWHPPTAGAITPVGTIDSKYRPSTSNLLWGYSTDMNFANVHPVSGTIQADGTIELLSDETSNTYYFIWAYYVRG